MGLPQMKVQPHLLLLLQYIVCNLFGYIAGMWNFSYLPDFFQYGRQFSLLFNEYYIGS